MVVAANDLFLPSPKVLECLVENFVPRSLLPSKWKFTKKDAIQNLKDLMAGSNGQLDGYGSPENLLQHLRALMSFPASSSFYGLPLTAPYYADVLVSKSLAKDSFIYKTDVFPILQAAVSTIPLKRWEAELAVGMIACYLKTQESKVDPTEMVKVWTLRFDAFKKNFNEISQYDMESMKDSNGFEDFCVAKIAGLFAAAVNASQEDNLEILRFVMTFSEKYPINRNGLGYQQTYTWLTLIVCLFEKFIEDKVNGKSEECSIAVRMFENGSEKIVIAHELLHWMKRGGLDVSGCEAKIMEMPSLATVTFRQVFDLVPKESLKKINFVVVQVRDDVTPIPINGGYCLFKEGEFFLLEKDESSDESDTEDSETEEADVVAEAEAEQEKQDTKQVVAAVEAVPVRSAEKTKRKKKIPASKKKVVVQSEASASPNKESEACQKCYRASLHTRNSNEKLRLEKIETKALKKKVVELELENAKKDEKLSQMEAENKEKDARIRILEKMLIQKAQVEEEYLKKLDDKTEIIEDLEAAISFSPEKVTEEVIPTSTETTSSESEVVTEKDLPSRSNEETEKVRNVLFTLLKIQATVRAEGPISKVSTMSKKLTAKTESDEVRRRSKYETILYRQACTKYIEAVESNLSVIRANQQITVDQIPELPLFPTLSQWFRDAYKETMKIDAPKICESLVKTAEVVPDELVDKECLICLDQMNEEEETQKCECCKRRYHKGCIQNWFQIKRSCPTCSSGLLDDQEFPSLI